MSDTMREDFEQWYEHDFMQGMDGPGEWDEERNCYVVFGVHMAWKGWQAAQSQPAPPVPASVQDIMPLLNAYVLACVNFEQAKLPGIEAFQSAEYAKLCATYLPLQAALTALVDENHRLKFELDGVNAMRRPLTDERIREVMESVDFTYEPNKFARAIEAAHGIAPEQGGNHG